ncbi:MAG: peptidylprolyl isomerase [Candidatus Sumerlaeia bacterium]|nr:peptidylprolyl isomerase [Candidatus Sumerlaeia bacterium]
MRRLSLTLALLALVPAATAQTLASGEVRAASPEGEFSRVAGLYALFYIGGERSFACRLFEDKTYRNVRNFIDLACGYREWTDPRDGTTRREPYYDGTIVYHVARNAMLVGGDPLANGLGSPGHFVEDEIRPDLTFDLPGRLAMANLGGRPDTNSGTWFVTASPLPELTGRHTIIGEVVQGLDDVIEITRAPADRAGRPLEEILVERVDIVRILERGVVVRYERSTTRPYNEIEGLPMAARTTDLPIWLRPEGSAAIELPPLPPIYGALGPE